MKNAAPYVAQIGSESSVLGQLKNLVGKIEGPSENGKEGMFTGLIGGAENALGMGKNLIDNGLDTLTGGRINNSDQLLGSTFLSAFDMIKTFAGTDVSFSIPKLENTWVHGLIPKEMKDESISDNIKERFKYMLSKTLGKVEDVMKIYGLQLAPNGYLPTFTNLQGLDPFKGTFELRIGKQYTITNLVLKNFSFNPSTIKVKGAGINNFPLYANVSYDLEHASFMTSDKLYDIFRIPPSQSTTTKPESAELMDEPQGEYYGPPYKPPVT
jgi:hypothetical protein